MSRAFTFHVVALLALALGYTSSAAAQSRGPARPSLFFREEWKQNAKGGEHAVVPGESLSNPALELTLHGPAANEFPMSGIVGDETNPVPPVAR